MRSALRVLAGVLAIGMAAAAGPPVAAAPRPAPPGKVSAQEQMAWVTLVTGDRVAVTDGRPRGVEPARRARSVQFAQFAERGDWYVIPSDAYRLVNAGTVDRQLFNVTGLVRQKYDDAHTKVVPLLAEYPEARSARAPAGARKGRVFPRLNLARLDAQKPDAARFWTTVASGGSTGPRKLWLNAKVRATLDQSVPQVGAPAAWQAGHTGKGVTVAVLDTGYDTDHPDLAGRVGPTQDFSGTGTVEDRHGHGTHVASSALGSGAASGGKYRGVAPDATLAVGKVLDDGGFGTAEGVIAGMEWAAATVKAKIVNMSLGAGQSDGSDPVSLAVNRLSKDHGTLFVIAAGNAGVDERVSSPASADAALAVGSVTKTDDLSPFSSRGPRLIDNALKPDLAAPGSAIVAARATGTYPERAVDENYSRLSGTSMATPHVAGAAAILAQQHPDWSGEQLKAALMGTAKPLDKLGLHEIGAGRLDLARATSQQVVAVPGSISAYLKWPHANTPARQHTVTYRNSGTAPATLALDVTLTGEDGAPAPTSVATLSAKSVTVPVGGTAVVTLTVKAAAGSTGNFAGVLTATGGTNTVRTPVGVYVEPELYDLTFAVKDRTGAASDPLFHSVAAVNVTTGKVYVGAAGDRFRVAPGRYVGMAEVATPSSSGEPSVTYLAHPDIRVTRGTVIRLDARTGTRIRMGLDQPAANGGLRSVIHRVQAKSEQHPFFFFDVHDPRLTDLYAASVPGARSAAYSFTNWLHGEEPKVDMSVTGPEPFAVDAHWPFGTSGPDMDTSVGLVHGGAGTAEDLAKVDVKGKLVTLVTGSLSWDELRTRLENVMAAGGRAAMLAPDDEAMLAAARTVTIQDGEDPWPWFAGSGATAQRLVTLAKKGGATVKLKTTSASRYRYEVLANADGAIPKVLNYDTRTKDLAAVRTRYHALPGSDLPAAAYPEVTIGGRVFGSNATQSAPSGVERTEYFTPGDWSQLNVRYGGPSHELVAQKSTLRAGAVHALDWNKAAHGPAFTGTRSDGKPWAGRNDGLIDVTVPLFSDAAGHTSIWNPDETVDTGKTSLYRNGKLHGSVDMPGRGAFPVPFDRADYRLTTSVKRSHASWPIATEVSAAWTFTSQGDEAVLPLLTVGLDPALDLRNTAPGGGAFTFPATVTRQAGSGSSAVMSLTVDVSYDDGATWAPATVARDGAKWTVSVQHPQSGFVSLRAKAADAQGNTVEQTVIRAYALT